MALLDPILSSSSIAVAVTLPILSCATVDNPATLRSSKVVCPSTSMKPDISTLLLISTVLANVETPVKFKC